MITPGAPRDGSLVLYKLQPALCVRAGEKLTLELPDGETVRVRPKDVAPLHPGPLASLGQLLTVDGEVEAAWDVLQGSVTTLPELAELAFGSYTPSTAWAAWQLIQDGVYFRQAGDAIAVNAPDEVARIMEARRAEETARQAWKEFIERARRKVVAPEDDPFWLEVEARALGQPTGGRILRALGRDDTPEAAHQLLLDVGRWDEQVNPRPQRLGLALTDPPAALGLPWPPLHLEQLDAARTDLTALRAFAIDDTLTDTPDDAVSIGAAPGVLDEEPFFWVHIADAAAAIPPDSALDLAARARGSALHIPEGHLKMLPADVIARLGLGLEGVSRALSFALRVDADGAPELAAILPSWVRVERLSYDAADTRIGEASLATMTELAQRYERRRDRQGRVAIELPEVDVRVLDGQVVIRPVLTGPSRTLVENAMIMTGEAVARYAAAAGLALPFSTQELAEDDPPVIEPGSMASMFAARKVMKRSQHRLTPGPHDGLGLDVYAQATSPLRRYLDLVVHQQLRADLAVQAGGEATPPLDEQQMLARIGAVEEVLGDVRIAETQSDRHWTLVYLLQHPGWSGPGVVVEHKGRQTVVLLPELGLETQLHLPDRPAPDTVVRLGVSYVDLPTLEARFRAEPGSP